MIDTKQIEGVVDFTDEELELFLKGVGRCSGQNVNVYDWYKKLCKYAELRKKIRKKGVIILTDCGEQHHVETSQPVSEIYLNGKLVHTSTGKVTEK